MEFKMKHFSKKRFVFLSIIISFFIILISPSLTFAEEKAAEEATGQENCHSSFFGLNPLECGTTEQPKSEEELKNNVIVIAANVLTDLTIIAAYLVVGYVIYGGYLYMFSSGDSTKAANGKKTLLHAFIGLAIVMSASIILGAIRVALVGNAKLTASQNVDTNAMVTNLIQWVVGISGVVAAVFLIIGGISYITSSGDSNKLQKAKSTILYAIIGLIIVALAEIATAFVSNLIRNSQKQAITNTIQTTLITRKENQ